jgi:cytochrome c biogenesis protein CcdA
MILVGILLTFFGFVIGVSSLAVTASAGGRLVIVMAGIAVSLFGILGVLNPAYQKNAVWKKGLSRE